MEQNTNRLLWAVGLLALGALLLGGSVLAQENFLPKISQAFVKMIDGKGSGYSDEEIDDLIKKGFIPVATAEELNNVRNATVETYGAGTKWEDKYLGGLDKKYIQVKTVDLSGYSEGEGWTPIGTWSEKFTGSYDGNGYKITGLTINRPETSSVGLFGVTEGATIDNVALENVDIKGNESVGGLVAHAYFGTNINNSYATGSVTGTSNAGGLVGYAWGNTNISNSYSTGSVTGTSDYVGGLVGWAQSGTKIINSYATGSVEGRNDVGGLVGQTYSNTISNSYATGDVTGTGSEVGGLVGKVSTNAVISNSYATGAVTGNEYVGGLVGDVYYNTNINNSYATGSVEGSGYRVGGLAGRSENSNISNSYAKGTVTGTSQDVGGFVGRAYSGTISNSYATGSVKGSEDVGGFVGEAYNDIVISNSYAIGSVESTGTRVGGLVGKTTESGWNGNTRATISNSYWDKETTLQEESARGTGKSTVEMKEKETYLDWDFTNVWEITPGNYPKLR